MRGAEDQEALSKLYWGNDLESQDRIALQRMLKKEFLEKKEEQIHIKVPLIRRYLERKIQVSFS